MDAEKVVTKEMWEEIFYGFDVGGKFFLVDSPDSVHEESVEIGTTFTATDTEDLLKRLRNVFTDFRSAEIRPWWIYIYPYKPYIDEKGDAKQVTLATPGTSETIYYSLESIEEEFVDVETYLRGRKEAEEKEK